jgi:hypothetical protein
MCRVTCLFLLDVIFLFWRPFLMRLFWCSCHGMAAQSELFESNVEAFVHFGFLSKSAGSVDLFSAADAKSCAYILPCVLALQAAVANLYCRFVPVQLCVCILHSASQETMILTVRFVQEQRSQAALSQLNSTIISLKSNTSRLTFKLAQAESQTAAADTRQALLGHAFSTTMSPLARMLLLGLAFKLGKVSLGRHAIATKIRSLVRAMGRVSKLCCVCAPCHRRFFALLEAVDEPITIKYNEAWLCPCVQVTSCLLHFEQTIDPSGRRSPAHALEPHASSCLLGVQQCSMWELP